MNFIKKARRAKGLAQKEIAEKLNISLSGYKKLEYGINKLTMARFIQICKVIEIDPSIAIKEVSENV